MDNKKVLDEFIKLCKIDSESFNEKEISDYLFFALKDLGLDPQKIYPDKKHGSNGYSVYAHIKGTLPGDCVLLSSHIDTVTPGKGIEPYVKDGCVYSQDGVILGGDDKSGVNAILETTRFVIQNNIPHRDYEIIFSVMEEVGLLGAESVDVKMLKSKVGFIFDGDGDVGRLIIGSTGYNRFKANIIGKAAHAGMCPERGVSAIVAFSNAVSKMQLGRIDFETTANVGRLSSNNNPTNQIAETVDFGFEVRSIDKEKFDHYTNEMLRIFREESEKIGAKFTYVQELGYASYKYNEDTPVVKMADESCKRLGIEYSHELSVGCSDATIYSTQNIPCVLMSTGMENCHSQQEYIKVKNLEDCANQVFDIITH